MAYRTSLKAYRKNCEEHYRDSEKVRRGGNVVEEWKGEAGLEIDSL